MKKFVLILMAAVAASAAPAALPQPDLIAEIHFAGAGKIAADRNYHAYTNEFCCAEAQAMWRQTADKLAPWLATWLQQNVGTPVPGGAAKLRPLLEDLRTAEWFLEARAAADGRPDVALAVRLDADRMVAWQEGLKPFFPGYAFKQSGGWLIFDSGTGTPKAANSLAPKMSAQTAEWLSVDLNWPHLAQWLPGLKALALPETLFAVTASEKYLHIDGKFFFPENLSLKLEAWQFPSNTVHQPLASFTAVRGFAGWLNGQDWAQPLRLSQPVNQLFTWSMNGMAFESFAAVPVPDAAAAFRQLDANLQPVVAQRNANGGFVSPFTLETTDDQMSLMGSPIILPYVQALKEPAGQFLLAGGFPNTARTRPLPQGLFQGLATPNLLYYHWEITAARFPSQLELAQLSLMVTRHREIETDPAAFMWVNKIGRLLGNAVTEITQTGPDQMTFTRSAAGGLTAFEFQVLAGWLGAPDFPHWNLNLPAHMQKSHPGNPVQMVPITPVH